MAEAEADAAVEAAVVVAVETKAAGVRWQIYKGKKGSVPNGV